MRIKRRSVAGLALIAAFAVMAGCSQGGSKAVARVNEAVITQSEFRESLKRLIPQGTDTGKEDLLEIKKDLLGQLIEEKLLLEEAKKTGITATDDELSSEVEALKNELGDQSFKDTIIERYGNLDKWKDEIRRKIVMRKTIEKAIGALPAVTEREAKEYYASNPDEFTAAESVKARMIVLASEDEARKVRGSLTAADFAETAKKVSMGPEKASGGDLGFFARGEMPAAFEDAVFKLTPGQLSPVVKTEYGFHIFLLEKRKKGGKLSFAEARDRITERLKSEKEDEGYRNWMASLKKNARIEVMEDLL